MDLQAIEHADLDLATPKVACLVQSYIPIFIVGWHVLTMFIGIGQFTCLNLKVESQLL
jgi:hypothetical protein